MMATIRSSARIFKAAVDQIIEVKQKIKKSINKLRCKYRKLRSRVKDRFCSFFSRFSKRKMNPDPQLISSHTKSKCKVKKNSHMHSKKLRKKERKKQAERQSRDKKTLGKDAPISTQMKQDDKVDSIEGFYAEWEENWGPVLNSSDKEFLKSISPEKAAKVMSNARLTLKSPYLKAVYNGLKDLEDISDLLENDELAKERVRPVFKDYWDKGPEKFSEMLIFFHDKGCFPTRSGERRLSLDPRLIPQWLGLVA